MSVRSDLPPWLLALIALGEKAVATWVQAFIVALLGSSFFDQVDLTVLAAAGVASIPAGITVLANAANSAAAPSDWPPFGQAVFRIVRTWVAAFLGFLAVAQWVLDLSATRGLFYSAVGAAGAALLAAIKAELATYVGDRTSTALLSARFDSSGVR